MIHPRAVHVHRLSNGNDLLPMTHWQAFCSHDGTRPSSARACSSRPFMECRCLRISRRTRAASRPSADDLDTKGRSAASAIGSCSSSRRKQKCRCAAMSPRDAAGWSQLGAEARASNPPLRRATLLTSCKRQVLRKLLVNCLRRRNAARLRFGRCELKHILVSAPRMP